MTILRLANMIGPAMDTTLSRYLAGPLVPTMFGRDARLQLLHEQDALGALERAAMAGNACEPKLVLYVRVISVKSLKLTEPS